MKWANKVELLYRVYARQHSSSEHLFEEVRKSLAPFSADFGEIVEIYLPCSVEKLDRARKNGWLVTDFQNRPCLVIKEMSVVIHSDKSGKKLVDKIIEALGSKNIFASIRIVQEALTEIQAV
jgi:hypothetical protein